MKKIKIITAIMLVCLYFASQKGAYGVQSKQHLQKNRLAKICNLMEDEEVLIIPERSQHEGRELFTVLLPSGEKMEHMYIEEILNGMKNDVYTYDEDLQ